MASLHSRSSSFSIATWVAALALGAPACSAPAAGVFPIGSGGGGGASPGVPTAGSPSLVGTNGGAGGAASVGAGATQGGAGLAQGGGAGDSAAGAPTGQAGDGNPAGGTSGLAGDGAGGTPTTGGASGAAGNATGGTAGAGGAPNTTGAAYPFPQNQIGNNCILPANYDNADVLAAYELWKETVVTSDGAGGHLRVKKPDSGNVIGSTVSEGMGYGMLLAVYMDDQEVFDELWLYVAQYLNGNGLMDWEVDPNGQVIGTGAALDGDEDMAWALIMADRQWGGQGTLEDTYLSTAQELVRAMWDHEIDHGREEMPLPGDAWGGADITNISYYAPAYYRVFGQITDNEAGWNQALDTSYDIIERSLNAASGNQDNGLVPAWCNFAGTPVEAFDGAPLHFQNDSTRTPFRVGQDYCYYGDARALDYMEKITSFYTSVGVDAIVDGYDLDGTPRPEHSMNGEGSASFVGPAAVGASYSIANQAFVDEAYTALASGELNAGTIYYQQSWTALSLLMVTGGFYEFPAP